MHRGIKKVYLGLPSHLASKVFWVNREYRLNNLSHIPGGADVIVEYHDESVLGYDWIKMPSKYIKTFWYEHYIEIFPDFDEWNEKQQLAEIKKKVKSIYARKYSESDFETVPFQEVWNFKNSENTPWNALEMVDTNSKSKNDSSVSNLGVTLEITIDNKQKRKNKINANFELTFDEFQENYGKMRFRDGDWGIWCTTHHVGMGPSVQNNFENAKELKTSLAESPDNFIVAWFNPDQEGHTEEVIRLIYLEHIKEEPSYDKFTPILSEDLKDWNDEKFDINKVYGIMVENNTPWFKKFESISELYEFIGCGNNFLRYGNNGWLSLPEKHLNLNDSNFMDFYFYSTKALNIHDELFFSFLAGKTITIQDFNKIFGIVE
jgi:hypothetical protein